MTAAAAPGRSSGLREALGRDWKGKLSPVRYTLGIVCALFITEGSHRALWAAVGFFMLVAVIWLVPDRRLERHIVAHEQARAT